MDSYGLWLLVVLNSAIFVLFAFSFVRPRTSRDWRSFGAFSAFLVALFTEMYGFPLTLYLLSGWLQSNYPQVDWLSHDSGHLLEMFFGWRGFPHLGPFHLLSMILVGWGFVILARAWPVLYRAQKLGVPAQEGPYRRIRHPQYAAFVLIMTGFLIQWPTILTVLMYPGLVAMYVRLAIREEREAEAQFGEAYRAYAARVPRFIPARQSPVQHSRTAPSPPGGWRQPGARVGLAPGGESSHENHRRCPDHGPVG